MRNIIIVGGGAAGFFAAINAAEFAKANQLSVKIKILESSDSVLKKVRISGGGRCNVTHHQFEVRRFCENYPRGSKELLSAMQQFQARDTVEWFAQRGVTLVAEADGRMFPDTNDSATVINCFLEAAAEAGVEVLLKHIVSAVRKPEDSAHFEVDVKDREVLRADAVMIATGSSQNGYKLAKELGHSITNLAPSLFSFKIEDELLKDLSGLSFSNAGVKLIIEGEKPFQESGPLLITHWGLSGPAVLKISAWAAREMMAADYKAKLTVNWLGVANVDLMLQELRKLKENNLKAQIQNVHPAALAKRFWQKLLAKCQVPEDKRCADMSNKEWQALADALVRTEFVVAGKNRYKDEFVECGGVDLKEINFKTMQSKICPGLYFSGEVLDIDGITGGFNFQNAWTGAYIAAKDIAAKR